MGSLAKGFLRKVCGNSAENSRKFAKEMGFIAPGSGVALANQTKKSQFMNFSQGHSGTKVQCESCLFS